MKEISKEIEDKISKGKMDIAYDIVKLTSFQNRTKSSIVKNKKGELLIDTKDISDRWKQYIEELYNGEDIEEKIDYIEQDAEVRIDFKGPAIIRKEFDFALEQLKNKAAGPDLLKSELLKNADEEVKNIIYEKIQDCYVTGNILNDFTISTLVMIPKKGNTTDCANYRALSLISHTSKILLNIIKNRIKVKVENNIDDDQFGFRLRKGTREALLALRILLERRMDMNRSTYIAFVDIEKAFDNVKWKTLF